MSVELTVGVASVLLASLPIAWWTYSSVRRKLYSEVHRHVFLADETDKPRLDLSLVGPNGLSVYPDIRGVVFVPSAWNGSLVSVRDKGQKEILSFQLDDANGEIVKLNCPRKPLDQRGVSRK